MTRKPEFKILPMSEEHIPEVARLEIECFSVPWSPRMLRDAISSPTGVYLAAVSDNGVLGYIGADFVLDTGYITNIAVAPGMRRRGIGAALLSALTREAAERNLKYLTLEVRRGNIPAISLYSSRGFKKTGERPGYYKNPDEDADIMTAEIQSF
jgi:ribosomal-protein-alanine N-acetyltransferase